MNIDYLRNIFTNDEIDLVLYALEHLEDTLLNDFENANARYTKVIIQNELYKITELKNEFYQFKENI